MEKLKFEFDHELAKRMRDSHEQSAREAATAEYHQTTEWMLRVAGRLFLRIAAGVALLVLLAWLFLG